MPLQGLPTSLENLLHYVLKENKISSFKLECQGEKSVVVLRLTALTEQEAAMADTSTTFRRKSPSQVKRDKRRAEQFKASKTKTGESSTNDSTKGNYCLQSTSNSSYIRECRPTTNKRTDSFERCIMSNGARENHAELSLSEFCASAGVEDSSGQANSDPVTPGSTEDSVSQSTSMFVSETGLHFLDNNSLYASKELSDKMRIDTADLYHQKVCFQCRLKLLVAESQ
jgi:hypothetical protein